jgi:hypothetical protein
MENGPTRRAFRAFAWPATGVAAALKLTLGRLVSAFDPPAEVETRVDLAPDDDVESERSEAG